MRISPFSDRFNLMIATQPLWASQFFPGHVRRGYIYIYICNIYPSLQSDLRLLFALLYCFWHTIPVHLTTPQTPTPSLTFRQQKAAKAKAKAAAQAATAQQAAAAKAKPKPKPKAQVGDLDKQGGGHRSPFTHHESR